MDLDHEGIPRGGCGCGCNQYRKSAASNRCRTCECVARDHCAGSCKKCRCKAYENNVAIPTECVVCGHGVNHHTPGKKIVSSGATSTTTSAGMMDETWGDIANKQKNIRAKNLAKRRPCQRELVKCPKTLTITKLMFDGSKYRKCPGLKVLVPFNQPLTVENVKSSCCDYFHIPQITGTSCKIMGGVLGPEFTEDYQIQGKTCFHFYKESKDVDEDEDDDDDDLLSSEVNSNNPYVVENEHSASAQLLHLSQTHGVKRRSNTKSLEIEQLSHVKRAVLSEDVPKSSNSTGSLYLVQITSDGIKWKETSFPIKYRVTSLIGEGGMRNCYNCDLLSSNVLDTTLAYVVKTYKDSTIRTMYEIHYKPHLSKSKNEAIISMTKKEVQSQMSARMLSLNFKDVIPKEFGEAPRIIPCYMIQDNNSHHVYVLEEKLKGKFVKYMNNDGRVYKDLIETEHGKKISAFCHFVYHKYNRKLMVADLQGVGLSLTDISMATWEVGDLETQELYFGCDNMSQQALNNFCQEHTCNSYCRLLKLKDMEPLVDLIDEQLKGEGLDCESNIIQGFRSPDKIVD